MSSPALGPRPPIEEVFARHRDAWMRTPGVVGVAIGHHRGEPCLQVHTSIAPAEVAAAVGAEVEGWPVVVRQVGEVRAV